MQELALGDARQHHVQLAWSESCAHVQKHMGRYGCALRLVRSHGITQLKGVGVLGVLAPKLVSPANVVLADDNALFSVIFRCSASVTRYSVQGERQGIQGKWLSSTTRVDLL